MQGGERPEAAAVAHLVWLCAGSGTGVGAGLAAAEHALAVLWNHLAQLLGERGARAVFGRALRLTQRRRPLARRVRIGERRLDFAQLESDAALLGDDALAAVIDALASALVEVVAALIGLEMLETVLGDVDLVLARQAGPASHSGNVQQRDQQQPKPRTSPDHDA